MAMATARSDRRSVRARAKRASRRLARARRGDARTPRWTRSPTRSRRGPTRSSRPTRATWRPGARAGCRAALLDRLRARRRPRRARWPAACATIAALPDPVGEVIDGRRLPNGLDVRKMRVPLGVVAVVYEARPNVTIDAAALCLKSGNAIVLRGSSSAAHSNAVLAAIAGEAAAQPGCPRARRCSSPAAGARSSPSSPRRTGVGRPDHPARRRGPEGGAEGRRDGAGDLRRVGQLPRVRRRERRPRPGARRSSSTPRPSARASATPPRRCWCTPRWRRAFLPGALAALRDARRRAARRRRARARSPATRSAARSSRRPRRTGTRSSSR